MMQFEVTEDGRWLKLTEYTDELDLRQVEISFTKKVKDWVFLRKRAQFRGWDGNVAFFQKKKFLPIGLWHELLVVSKKHNLGVEISGLERIVDMDFKLAEFQAWVEETFPDGIGGDPDKPIRPYQIEAAFKIIKFGISTQELATNAGKTFIVFMAIAYMMSHGKCSKFLMIVPNVNLVLQAVDDWQDYGAHRFGMKFQQIHGGENGVRSEANVVIGNFQMLVKKDVEFLSKFDTVFVDEAHQSPANSIKKIVSQCANSKCRFGLSGTLTSSGEDSADYLTIQMCLGPVVGKISPDFLFKNNYATPVHVKVVRMNYLVDDARERLANVRTRLKNQDAGSEAYNIERKLVVGDRKRLNFIVDFILKTTKNSMVLFQNVEDDYGRTIYDMLRDQSSDREVFYVDGDVDAQTRESFKVRMKSGNNRILVASFRTFSTGISIDNIHNIFFVESYKSENIIKQSIGRGMRKLLGKMVVNIIDFVDDFSWKSKPNYLMKHSDERIKIYEREKFPYEIWDVDLSGEKIKFVKAEEKLIYTEDEKPSDV